MVALRGTDIVRVPLAEATARAQDGAARAVRRGRGLLRLSGSCGPAGPTRRELHHARAATSGRPVRGGGFGMRTRGGRGRGRNYPWGVSIDASPDVLAGLDAWRDLPAAQQPSWPDAGALDDRGARRSPTYPPLVFAGECDILRDRMAEAAARRGLRAAGRRLRRDVRVGDRRQHPRPDQDDPADGGRAHLRRLACRSSRSAGWPGSTPSRAAPTTETRDGVDAAGLPRRHGQRLRLHADGPHPRPAAAGPGLPRQLGDPEPRPRLHHRAASPTCATCTTGTAGFVANSANAALRADRQGHRQGDALHGGLRRRLRRDAHGRVLRRARGAAARLRAADDPHRLAHRPPVRHLGALRLGRRAHPRPRRRAHRLRLAHPATRSASRLGPKADPDELLRLIDKVDPDRAAGPAHLHHPDGRRHDPRRAAVARRARSPPPAPQVTWICDPMHGNTFEVAHRLQDARLRRRRRRGAGLLRGAPRARHGARRHPRRAHRQRRHRVPRRRRRRSSTPTWRSATSRCATRG